MPIWCSRAPGRTQVESVLDCNAGFQPSAPEPPPGGHLFSPSIRACRAPSHLPCGTLCPTGTSSVRCSSSQHSPSSFLSISTLKTQTAPKVRAGWILALTLSSSVTVGSFRYRGEPPKPHQYNGGKTSADLVEYVKITGWVWKGVSAQCLAHSRSSVVSLSL